MDKLEKLRKEIERLKGWNNNVRNSTRRMTLQEEDFNRGKHSSYLEILSIIDSMQKEPKKCMYANDNYTDEDRKVLCEDCDHRCAYGVQNIGDYDHKAVIDAIMADVEEKSKAFTEAHKGESSDKILSEMRGEEPVSKNRMVFKAIPRLLEMLEPNDRAKAYTNRLADALEEEGYTTDAKIVREKIKIMNGETIAMATMDEVPVSEDVWESSKHYALLQVLASTDAEMTEQAYLSLKLFSGFEIAVAHKDGANWQKEQIINKACDYLKDNIWRNLYFVNGEAGFPTAEFIKGFRNAMEE